MSRTTQRLLRLSVRLIWANELGRLLTKAIKPTKELSIVLTHKKSNTSDQRLCLDDYPVFFIDLADWYEGVPVVTGTITSVMDLAEHQQVLLVNDILDPIVSVLATVVYSHSTIEGSVYRFTFNRNEIGVPTFC